MILPILVGTYGAVTAFNIAVPIIKKERTKKKVIQMFKDNGYDVDIHYVDNLFKKYDSYCGVIKEKEFYDLDEEDMFMMDSVLPMFDIYCLVINAKYLVGNYTDHINEKYDSFTKFDSYGPYILYKLEDDNIIEPNQEKLKYLEDVNKAKRILNKKEVTEVDLLAVKYEEPKEEFEEVINIHTGKVKRLRYANSFKIVNRDYNKEK